MNALLMAAALFAASLSGGPARPADSVSGLSGHVVSGQPVSGHAPVATELRVGDAGAAVGVLNDRLASLGFTPSEGDQFDEQTLHAVYAFQKYHGLERDGVFTESMWELADQQPVLPWRRERDRVEIDLEKQVLYLVDDGVVETVVTISSGSGDLYRGSNGRLVPARTPEGEFEFERRIEGLRRSYLGVLYNPFYFRGGYAVHGSPSVPNHPASHGCVRVTDWDMDVLKTRFEIGMPVLIYGLRTERPSNPPIELPSPILV